MEANCCPLVSQDPVDGNAVIQDVSSIRQWCFPGNTNFRVARGFVFCTDSSRHNIVSGNAGRTEVEQVDPFHGDRKCIAALQPVIPVAFTQQVDAGVSDLAVNVVLPVHHGAFSILIDRQTDPES